MLMIGSIPHHQGCGLLWFGPGSIQAELKKARQAWGYCVIAMSGMDSMGEDTRQHPQSYTFWVPVKLDLEKFRSRFEKAYGTRSLSFREITSLLHLQFSFW